MLSSTRRFCRIHALALGLVLAVAIMPTAGQEAASGRAFEPKDWYTVKTVASPAMSPDGKHVAVQVTSVVEAENERLREIWVVIELSPIRYADKVKTPTLIVQSEEDHRTPMADAEQWFMALKKHDVPVEFIRYPRSTHDLSRTGEPWLLVDRLGRLRQWFGHYLKEEPAARKETTQGAR